MCSASKQNLAPTVPCEGWWEQEHFGRQPMHELVLRIAEGRIMGAGWDVVGPFTLMGTISDGGVVTMLKRYTGQHQVEYLGTYDGEGGLYGQWRIGPLTDKWAICFQRPKGSRSAKNEDADLAEGL